MNPSWRAVWIAAGAGATLAVAVVPWSFAVPAAVTVALAVVLGILVVLGAGMLIRRGIGPTAAMTREHRSYVALMLWVALALHVGWVVAFAWWPQYWMAWPLALLALAGAEWATVAGVQWTATALSARQTQATQDAAAGGPPADDDTSIKFREALRRADLGAVRVVGWEPVAEEGNSGRIFGIEFSVQVPSKAAQKGR